MTAKQNQLYWREWAHVVRTARLTHLQTLDNEDRHEMHRQALGTAKSHKEFTNQDFDKVLGVFRAYSQPANLKGQLRQLNQERYRLSTVIQRQILVLGKFVDFPCSYTKSIMRDKFATEYLEDLRSRLQISDIRASAPEIDDCPQLEHMRMTLARVLSRKRQEWNEAHPDRAYESEHDLCQSVPVPCFRRDCAQCRSAKSAIAHRPSPMLDEQPAIINLNRRYEEVPA